VYDLIGRLLPRLATTHVLQLWMKQLKVGKGSISSLHFMQRVAAFDTPKPTAG
jgi:hypothetical protein